MRVEPERAFRLKNIFDKLPDRWDFLYLGYMENQDYMPLSTRVKIKLAYPVFRMFGYKKFNPNRIRLKYHKPYSDNLDIAGFHTGTHAYAVTNEGARKILRFQTPVIMAPDNAIGQMIMDGDLKALRLKERVFYQNRELPTTIDGR